MSPYMLSMALSSLSIGTLTTFISHHWFLVWIGLEINTLAILPLMTQQQHPRAVESATKYFLIQASASALILFAAMINAWANGEWSILNMHTLMSSVMITIALAMKLGIAPFHLWLPDVLQGLNLFTCLIMSTWQKLAPMALLILMHNQLNTQLLMLMALLSALIGGWGGLNQTQLRKIMAYSSIAHLGWMLMVITFSPHLMTLNLMIYLVLTTSMFMALLILSAHNINQLSISWVKNPMMMAIILIILVALGGLPPTTGFMPKWLILLELIKQGMTTVAFMMSMTTLLSLFFYIRLSYMISLTTSPNMSNSKFNWRFKNKTFMLMSLLIILSLMLLPITPLLTSVM
uniref:NADH-ubiquinone oxidoreductase chain 2 n=3 Tax=Andrias davidianus TaxID=141262 RepID=A0A3Q8ATT0_ANDDA|nr:NADH dehydrogenase subunit 2 [Andrias davidianus]APB92243.1 NADH dehydrogenase subunit 2 [Andrias davidianus]APB92256.1 NADH dehydrogenase subunit 2 [Andrias davidianus]QBC75189.1 NADH dehydrogenase subunit 2 [Andrias davidianus]